MGKIVTIEYVDDLDDISIDAESVDTVEFSFRGQDYTLVLTKKNGAQFNKDMARYIKAAKKAQAREAGSARKAGRPQPRKSARKQQAAPRKAASRKTAAAALSGTERTRAIREWAVATGRNVSRRGRIPAAIEAAYDAAH